MGVRQAGIPAIGQFDRQGKQQAFCTVHPRVQPGKAELGVEGTSTLFTVSFFPHHPTPCGSPLENKSRAWL